MLKDRKTYIDDDRKAHELTLEQAEPEEYAVIGWFKWTAKEKKPWHSMFRFTINDEEVNENAGLLGDRTLAAFVGKEGI